MTTGDIIQEKRTEAGMTQQVLADRLGVNRSLIAQYERGSKVPTVTMAKRIAEIFGCTVDVIAGVA